MSTITPYERKVNYYETDKMGIMHHSNYIRVFEEARIYYLDKAGMPFDVIESMGIYMPTLELDCRYKRPLIFNETFFVEVKGEKFNGATLYLSYKIVNKDNEICAEGTSKHCFTDKSMHPIRIRKSHPELYEVMAAHFKPDEK